MLEKKRKPKYFGFLMNANTENILIHFSILTEPSTNHHLFQNREIRSLPGDSKIRYKKINSYISRTKCFIPFHFKNTNNIFNLRFLFPKVLGKHIKEELFH